MVLPFRKSAVDILTHRLLVEGAPIFPDAVRLEAALGKLDRSLRVATRPPFDFTQLNLSPAVRQLLGKRWPQLEHVPTAGHESRCLDAQEGCLEVIS